MQRSIYTDHELLVASERNQKYRGTARISLKHIRPHRNICRSLDTDNVTRLCEIFNKEGCRRLEATNHVSAVVSMRDLNAALEKVQLSTAQLISGNFNQFPSLPFSKGQVRCLHGQHRLQAGKEFLPEYDQWWVVDLYLDGQWSPKRQKMT